MGKRADLLPSTRGHIYSDWELRESVRRNGILHPLIYFRGRLIDGSRRVALAESLDTAPPTSIQFDVARDAAAHLFTYHPRRAYQLFAHLCCGRRPRHASLVRLFACAPQDIPPAKQVRDRTRARRTKPTTARLPSLSVDALTLETAHAECRAQGITLTDAIRGLVEHLGRLPPTSSAG